MPAVSEKQRRAMEAAAHGHSTLGIPKSVGEEFVGRDDAETYNGERGRWVTINGVHVFIDEKGFIAKGPASMVGKRPNEIGESGPTPVDRATPTEHSGLKGHQMRLVEKPPAPRKPKAAPKPHAPRKPRKTVSSGSTERTPGNVIHGETPEEQTLKSVEPKHLRSLGGGVNETLKVDFPDGTSAVFKPEEGLNPHVGFRSLKQGFDVERECAAWQVAKLVGLADLVPPTVERTLHGKRGSLMFFEKGTVAKRAGMPFDGDEDSARAAVFDYVIGNKDRNGGNWLMQNGKLKLIDHNLTFPEGEYIGYNQQFIKHVFNYGRDSDALSPHALIKPYLKALPEIRESLKELGLPASIDGVEERIHHLASSDTWSEAFLDAVNSEEDYDNDDFTSRRSEGDEDDTDPEDEDADQEPEDEDVPESEFEKEFA